MRSPGFWWRPPGLAARLLAPAGALYGRLSAARMDRPGARGALPVVCVGNFTLGGAGKTPTALALAAALAAAGRRPAFLSRGYGGRLAGPVGVDPARHAAADVGDEPLLLARRAPTVVARDRPAGAALCAALGADVVVMDDGLQNPSLAKDLCLAVVDAGAGFGNGRVMPAGPLRAPLARQWPHAHALVLVGEGAPGEEAAQAAAARGLRVLRATLVPDPAVAAALAGRRVLAFAGIGRPEKFFATLRTLGAEVVRAEGFPDHHAYTREERARLLAAARREDLLPVTTEKDAARLAGDALGTAATALPVRLAFAGPADLTALLERLGEA